MSNKHLHIISFDVPLPANYGGVIDVFYKIKALHKLGYKIHLHAYDYGRGKKKELEEYCFSVNYYKRNLSRQNLFRRRPFIVLSRNSVELYQNLMEDDFPILFEGLHSTYYLSHPDFAKRTKIVRTHNIEHEYYERLAEAERSIFKRYYFQNEASKLKRYENVLRNAQAIVAISEPDHKYFQNQYGKSHLVSAFHPYSEISIEEGIGDYALYHGNLGVPENDKAAVYLIKEVFADLDVKLKIAGNDPSPELRELCSVYSNVSLMSDVSTEEIDALVSNAQINVLPTFQATGIKLKLLSALFQGRHALVNPPMVEGTGLEKHVEIASTSSEMKEKISELMKSQFALNGRRELEEGRFSNQMNTALLDEIILGDQ